MSPQVDGNVETNGTPQEPLRLDAEGHPVLAEWDESDPEPEVGPRRHRTEAERQADREALAAERRGEVDDQWAKASDQVIPSEHPIAHVPEEILDVQAEWVEPEPPSQEQAVRALEKASDSDLMAMAGIEPIMSTTEAAEYFDRTSQWVYWGLKPDENTGEHIFVWPDGAPIVPERIGDPKTGRRRFTTEILRAILQASYRRGNIEAGELQTIIRRIRYTELGVEWREREGWRYVDLGRNRHRWVKPEDAYYDRSAKVWKLRDQDKDDRPEPAPPTPEPPPPPPPVPEVLVTPDNPFYLAPEIVKPRETGQ